MLHQVEHRWPTDRQMNLNLHSESHALKTCQHRLETHIVPWHPCGLDHTESVADIILDVLEVHDTRIVVILAREQRSLEIRGVHVRKRVRVSVPAPEADIETTDACAVVVHNHEL